MEELTSLLFFYISHLSFLGCFGCYFFMPVVEMSRIFIIKRQQEAKNTRMRGFGILWAGSSANDAKCSRKISTITSLLQWIVSVEWEKERKMKFKFQIHSSHPQCCCVLCVCWMIKILHFTSSSWLPFFSSFFCSSSSQKNSQLMRPLDDVDVNRIHAVVAIFYAFFVYWLCKSFSIIFQII